MLYAWMINVRTGAIFPVERKGSMAAGFFYDGTLREVGNGRFLAPRDVAALLLRPKDGRFSLAGTHRARGGCTPGAARGIVAK